MMDMWNRVNRKYNDIKKDWKADCQFSKKYALLRFKDTVSRQIGLNKISDSAFKKREEYLIKYLRDCLSPVLDKYCNQKTEGEYVPKAPIWVCWWTGRENAPLIVQQCIKSIYNNAGVHPVILLSEKNYSQYLNVPDFILDKMKSGKMGLAHFSDYIRISLLEQYGGLWLDATIFCSKPISDKFFCYPFFTLKSPYKESRFVSKYQWVTFCLGAWKNNLFYSFVKEAFEKYWYENDIAIDYLFFDYIILLAKQNCSYISQLMDNVPNSELHRDDLQAAMNEALSAEQFYNVVQDDTGLYKLSWRENYSKTTTKGEMSVYAFFLSMT